MASSGSPILNALSHIQQNNRAGTESGKHDPRLHVLSQYPPIIMTFNIFILHAEPKGENTTSISTRPEHIQTNTSQ